MAKKTVTKHSCYLTNVKYHLANLILKGEGLQQLFINYQSSDCFMNAFHIVEPSCSKPQQTETIGSTLGVYL